MLTPDAPGGSATLKNNIRFKPGRLNGICFEEADREKGDLQWCFNLLGVNPHRIGELPVNDIIFILETKYIYRQVIKPGNVKIKYSRNQIVIC